MTKTAEQPKAATEVQQYQQMMNEKYVASMRLNEVDERMRRFTVDSALLIETLKKQNSDLRLAVRRIEVAVVSQDGAVLHSLPSKVRLAISEAIELAKELSDG